MGGGGGGLAESWPHGTRIRGSGSRGAPRPRPAQTGSGEGRAWPGRTCRRRPRLAQTAASPFSSQLTRLCRRRPAASSCGGGGAGRLLRRPARSSSAAGTRPWKAPAPPSYRQPEGTARAEGHAAAAGGEGGGDEPGGGRAGGGASSSSLTPCLKNTFYLGVAAPRAPQRDPPPSPHISSRPPGKATGDSSPEQVLVVAGAAGGKRLKGSGCTQLPARGFLCLVALRLHVVQAQVFVLLKRTLIALHFQLRVLFRGVDVLRGETEASFAPLLSKSRSPALFSSTPATARGLGQDSPPHRGQDLTITPRRA